MGEVARGRVESDARLTRRVVAHFNVGPAQPFSPAGAEALEHRLLGRPAPGEVFGGLLRALAVAYLAFGVDARQKQLPVAVDHPPDAHALDDVGADADDVHIRPMTCR